jgi:hypothetical protein
VPSGGGGSERAFEPDLRTWYPARRRRKCAADAGAAQLPALTVPADIPARRRQAGPHGLVQPGRGGANYGLERAAGTLTPESRGIVADPTDGTLPYQPGRARAQNRALPHAVRRSDRTASSLACRAQYVRAGADPAAAATS